MSDIAIQFENVGKLYHLGSVGTGTLSHDLNRWWQTKILRKEDPYLRIGETNDRAHRGNSDFVWALRDINFEVKQGEVVGIIGKNGAGKSTLLKLLSRVTAPTTGVIRARGRIASLLEVGTGFHQEMTGRENIYMNGAIMGMTRAEISRKLDAIVDFAGVERYLDTPVKRYSSGMTVRLGFAVAAFLEPEILVVDEVLAVGDAEFQKKAIGKMQDVSRGEGRTVLFVSHNMAAVRSLCQRGVVLEDGEMGFDGVVEDAVGRYLQSSENETESAMSEKNIKYNTPDIRITSLVVNKTKEIESTIFSDQHDLKVEIEGIAKTEIQTEVKLTFLNTSGSPIMSYGEGLYKGQSVKLPAGSFKIEKTIILPKYLGKGDLWLDLFLHRPMLEIQLEYRKCHLLHVEGSHDTFGRALISKHEGFIGLEANS